MALNTILRVGLFLFNEENPSTVLRPMEASGVSFLPRADSFEGALRLYPKMITFGTHIAILSLLDTAEEPISLFETMKNDFSNRNYPIRTIAVYDGEQQIDESTAELFDKMVPWSKSCAPALIAGCRELAESV